MLQRAIELAAVAHRGQFRKNGDPYILHPLRVMLRLDGEINRVVAVLHDVLEDASVTPEQLADQGFPTVVTDALRLLTHAHGQVYDDYIACIATNALATQIKLADLEDNLNVCELPIIADKETARIAKYHKARAFLLKYQPGFSH